MESKTWMKLQRIHSIKIGVDEKKINIERIWEREKADSEIESQGRFGTSDRRLFFEEQMVR